MASTVLFRKRNTDRNGGSFPAAVVEAVWQKGQPTSISQFRRDVCNATMSRLAHGDTNRKDGWEIDHIIPVAKGGSDDLSNLQPLQWENNRQKGDNNPPGAFCIIRS